MTRPPVRWLTALAAFGVLLCAIAFRADAQSAAQPPAAAAAQSSPQDDAAAKAAERKKKFEESRKRLEEAEPPSPSVPSTPHPKDNPAPTKQNDIPLAAVLPVIMEIGENQRFVLFTKAGENVTSRAEWNVSDASIAELRVIGGIPHLYGKSKGRVDVYGNVNGMCAQIMLTVIPKEEMKPGTVRWTNPDGPGGLLRILPAVPERDPSHY
jgi:hypothetical protein